MGWKTKYPSFIIVQFTCCIFKWSLNLNWVFNHSFCIWDFRYLYTDLYAGYIWAGTESPENSGKFNSTTISFSCAQDSPLPCSSVPERPFPSLGYIFSFGEDNKKDVYLLASSGVYRIVSPSRCNYNCSKENVTSIVSPPPPSPLSPVPSRTSGCQLTHLPKKWVCLFFSFLFVMNFSL